MELRAAKDSTGRFLTFALFFETRNPKFEPTFTLKEQDHEYEGIHYTSMRRLYMEMEDVTEYNFATTVLGSWDHWQKLCKSPEINKHIIEWRKELEIKLKAKAMQALIETASTAGSKGTTAAKWLAGAGWKEGKGRPSKEKLKGEVKKQMKENSVVSLDAKRLGLDVDG